jgi:hypothetical protein
VLPASLISSITHNWLRCIRLFHSSTVGQLAEKSSFRWKSPLIVTNQNRLINIVVKKLYRHHFESFMVTTLTWLTVTGYQYHKWPRICSACRVHNPVLSSFMTYHRVCNKCNTTDVKCGIGTAYPSGAPEFTPGFNGVRVARSLVFCLMFCRLLFVLLATVLSVLRFTASNYTFGIFSYRKRGL